MPKFELSLWQLFHQFPELYYTLGIRDKATMLRQCNGTIEYCPITGIYAIEFETQEDYVHYKLLNS